MKAAIEAAGGVAVTLTELRSRLAAAGHTVSRASLCRYLSTLRPDAPPDRPTGAVAAIARAADDAAVEADRTGAPEALLRAREELKAAMAGWAPKLARDPRAVRSYVTLANRLAIVERAIVACTPVPPESKYAPIEAAALAALLDRANTAADPGGTVAALESRVAAQAKAIERLLAGGASP